MDTAVGNLPLLILFNILQSEGEENPGAVIASYLLTSLDTITGGGAVSYKVEKYEQSICLINTTVITMSNDFLLQNNNGAFFGNLLSKLVKGTSAVCISTLKLNDPD